MPDSTLDKMREKYGNGPGAEENCLSDMCAAAEELDHILQGDVYGYVLKDAAGEELEDSCWGFIGDIKYVEEEANRAAENEAEKMVAEQVEREDMAARDIMTVETEQ